MIPHLSTLFLIPLPVWAVPCTQQSLDLQVGIEGKLSERASTFPEALRGLLAALETSPRRPQSGQPRLHLAMALPPPAVRSAVKTARRPGMAGKELRCGKPG